MRRVLTTVACALILLAGAPAAIAAVDDVHGPACADILGGKLNSFDGSVLSVTLTYADATCPQFTYSLWVVDDRNDFTLLASQSRDGDGTTGMTFVIPVSDPDETVCAYATITAGRHIFDRGPDRLCFAIKAGSGPPSMDWS